MNAKLMGKRFLLGLLVVTLCFSSAEMPAMAATTSATYQRQKSNKMKVGGKNYFFDFSENSSTIRFLCENKKGKISVLKKIQVKKYGIYSGFVGKVDACTHYGNDIYFLCEGGEEGESSFLRISIKTGKVKLIEKDTWYCCMLKKHYIVLQDASWGEYSPGKLMVYDAKTGKKKLINKTTGHAYPEGRYIFYSKVSQHYYPVNQVNNVKICRYDVMTGKTKVLVKSVKLSDTYEINKDYMIYYVEPHTIKVKEFSKGNKVSPKDGKYSVSFDGENVQYHKSDCFGAKINKNTLTVYGSYQVYGKKTKKPAKMYKFTLAPSYKIRIIEDEEIETITASEFNQYSEKDYYSVNMILTVKNKKITDICFIP